MVQPTLPAGTRAWAVVESSIDPSAGGARRPVGGTATMGNKGQIMELRVSRKPWWKSLNWRLLIAPAILLVVVAVIFWIAGCAVGRGPGGQTVLGVEVGEPMPEGFSEAMTQAGGLIGGLVGGPSGAAIGTGIAGTIAAAIAAVWGTKKAGDAKAARMAHEYENKGWDEREAAASIQAPLVAVQPSKSVASDGTGNHAGQG